MSQEKRTKEQRYHDQIKRDLVDYFEINDAIIII